MSSWCTGLILISVPDKSLWVDLYGKVYRMKDMYLFIFTGWDEEPLDHAVMSQ